MGRGQRHGGNVEKRVGKCVREDEGMGVGKCAKV